MTLPEQVFEPGGWENPMPALPAVQLPLREQKRTGHLFAKCPNPLPVPDNKGVNAPETCAMCAETLRVCREEGERWHALQRRDAAIWKVRGIPILEDGNCVPFPGKVPSPEHAAALGADYVPLRAVPAENPPSTPTGAPRMASEAQVKYLVGLAARKRSAWFNKVGIEEVRARAAALTADEASDRIDALKGEK